MPDPILQSGLTLLEAYRVAQTSGRHLVADPDGNVKVSPIIPPGWREIPLRIKVTAPDRGRVETTQRVAA